MGVVIHSAPLHRGEVRLRQRQTVQHLQN
jgi:hypothetical protein